MQNYFIVWKGNLPEWVGESGGLHVDRNDLKEWLSSYSYRPAGSIWTASRRVQKVVQWLCNNCPVQLGTAKKNRSSLLFAPTWSCQYNEMVEIAAKLRSVWMKTNNLLWLPFSWIVSKNLRMLNTYLIFVFLSVLEVS